MTDLEYIAYCYSSELTQEEKTQFENRIAEDHRFAEEVSFFLSTMQVVRKMDLTERKQQLREMYVPDPKPARVITLRKIIYTLATAAMLTGIVFGYFLLKRRTATFQLAKQYIQANFTQLPTTMSSSGDSLQTALDLYNKGQMSGAIQLLEDLYRQDSLNINTQKYAGIVYLRQKDYDKAIAKFRQLENTPGLNSNPGKFYHAIALMERNQKGDKEVAKALLQEVVSRNLEGAEVAVQWLKEL